MLLQNSQTAGNLMRAFAGESQAYMRYTLAAEECKKQQLFVLRAVFDYTAAQEKAHAEIFSRFLRQQPESSVTIGEAGYPVDLSTEPAALLQAARHNEYEEHGTVYPQFGDTAEQEGFLPIAAAFRQIAAVEKTHGDRFGRLAELLEQNRLFVSDEETGWICLNCGHIVHAKQAPPSCPVCHYPQGYFVRLEFSPYVS